MSSERLVFAGQGNENSWHAEAARTAAGTDDIEIIDCEDFRRVITLSIDEHPGLGVMAINTAAGTVAPSAKRILGNRSAALPAVVDRVDLEIGISLIGSVEQSIEELNRHGVTCYVQKEAQLQIDGFKKRHLPWLEYERHKESTHAVQDALAMKSPDIIAAGPSYSAKRIGGFVLGPEQVNPPGSITSFYILQRDPRDEILPPDPNKTTPITVIGLNYPEGPNGSDTSEEFKKCLDAMEKVGLRVVRYIPFRTGAPTRHNPNIKKNGGILEVQHGMYDPEIPKFCAKINNSRGKDGVDGPFDAKRLGEYLWGPEETIDLADISASAPLS